MHPTESVNVAPTSGLSRQGTVSTNRTPEYRDNIEDEEQTGLEIASAALGRPERTGDVPFYTGEQTGPTSALSILSPGQSLPKHFLIPSHQKEIPEEDREFLRQKGVFTLPGKDACDSMVEAYLLHVHPILPVVEVDILLQHHQSGQLHNYNLLILWSLFFAAVNFIPVNICEQEGFSSKRAMRFDMFSRARVCTETQASQVTTLPLATDKDRSGAVFGGVVSFRDRWLGLTLGRPLRINLDDCDIPMPSVDDMLFDIGSTGEDGHSPGLPGDMRRSAEYWIILIELSCQLGKVMAMNYQAARSKPSLQEVEKLEQELLQSRLPDQYEFGLMPSTRFYSNHVHLHYQAMMVTFYRPWGTDAPKELDVTAQKEWQHRMRLRADAAASRTNEILDALVQDNLLGFAGPMTPPLLVPAMQVHLFHCKVGDSLSKRVRLNKLEMCMLVMEELQKTYTVASIYRAVFTKALQLIFPGYLIPVAPFGSTGHAPAATGTTAVAAAAAVPASVSGAGAANSPMGPGYGVPEYSPPIDDGSFGVGEMDLMDALMDEASIFSFWEACSQI
ncbi:C6 transcription factor [Penicillium citrinum]|uniref:C6 transcription factor n=1 Tax=Penicillium citrinum TaxID=5077 RepID=A0A9W9PE16_PENCI|nr:C6 transcription factor [Penicillium citrinum]KAJ5241152.1 C6 transcription factor [Penicillium citrinum]